jgi:hypothetical protein
VILDASKQALGKIIQVRQLQRCFPDDLHDIAIQKDLQESAARQVNMHVVVI